MTPSNDHIPPRLTRRDFLQRGREATTGAVGIALTRTAVKLGAVEGAEFLAFEYGRRRYINDLAAEAAKLDRILELDIGKYVELLTNQVQQNLNVQSRELQRVYDENVGEWNRLGMVTGREVHQLQDVISKLENYEASYTRWEALRELSDRVTRRLAQVDERLEDHSPDFLKGINEQIRHLFGQEDVQRRTLLRQRLDELVKVYDENRDNRIAQTAVVERINGYLRDSKLTSEERQLFEYLRGEAQKENAQHDIRQFVQDYRSVSSEYVEQVHLQRLQNVTGQLDEVFEELVPTMNQLQGTLDQGITLRDKLRQYDARAERAKEVLEGYKTEVAGLQERMTTLKEQLETMNFDIDYKPSLKLPFGLADVVRYGYTGLQAAVMIYSAYVIGKRAIHNRGKFQLEAAQTNLGEVLYETDGLQNRVEKMGRENEKLYRKVAELERENERFKSGGPTDDGGPKTPTT